jgi:hypothetical protein
VSLTFRASFDRVEDIRDRLKAIPKSARSLSEQRDFEALTARL